MQTSLPATINYIGEINGRARFDPLNPAGMNFAVEPVQVVIHDAAPLRDRFTLENAGFAFTRHPYPPARDPDFFEQLQDSQRIESQAVSDYLESTIALLKDMTGARLIVPQLGGILVRASPRAQDKTWAQPAAFAHFDVSAVSARQFLEWSVPEADLQALNWSRFMLLQTWRAITPSPQDSLLAICDGTTVLADDVVPFDSILGPADTPGNVFESRSSRPNDAHRWYFLSDMGPDDLLVFKGFDSAHPDAMNALHSAFDNPLAGPDASARRSIEARFMALFE